MKKSKIVVADAMQLDQLFKDASLEPRGSAVCGAGKEF